MSGISERGNEKESDTSQKEKTVGSVVAEQQVQIFDPHTYYKYYHQESGTLDF